MSADRIGRLAARRASWAVLAGALASILAGCGSQPATDTGIVSAPSCTAGSRLGIVAQSVPTAAYVPCVQVLPTGWKVTGFHVASGHTAISLVSDRAAEHPVDVELRPGCSVTGATATTPRADGVRTYLQLTSIAPRFTGTMSDVFPGGCVTYRFDFARGPHIALMEELTTAVGLFSRRQLRLELRRDLGVELDP